MVIVVPITQPAPAWQSGMILTFEPCEEGWFIRFRTCAIVVSSQVSEKIFAVLKVPVTSIILSILSGSSPAAKYSADNLFMQLQYT